MAMSELWRRPATEIAALVRGREVSAEAVARDALARLDAANPPINAVVAHRPEEVLEEARALDARLARGEAPGLLVGVPVTIKVNADQKGFATTNGLRLQKDLIAAEDGPVVANLRRAGAVILGRTNAPAFSLRWFCDNLLHGRTLNPRNPGLTPGGSSGGAAAGCAAGIGAIAHGTDIGGSIRYPAYACGIHGLRPTLGRVAAWNPTAPERGMGAQLMAVSGPLARRVADLRLALAAMAAPDPRDPWWVPAPLEGPPVPRRAALCIAPEGMEVAAEIVAALRDAAARLAAAGWEVEEVAGIAPLREPARLQAALWLAEMRGSDLVAREGDPAAIEVFAHMERLSPPIGLDGYASGLRARAGFLREWNLLFERFPVVLMPVSGELPFARDADRGGFDAFARLLEAQLTQVGLPLMGLPGLAVSTGLVGGTPVGVQLVAGRYREDLLLAAAEAIEAGGAPPSPVDPSPG